METIWLVWLQTGWEPARAIEQLVMTGDLPDVARAWPPIKRETFVAVDSRTGELYPDGIFSMTSIGIEPEYQEASGSMVFTFGLALLIVFLVLAAQFESFVHPVVILVTVPLAVAGALLGLYLTGMSINIFSQIGIIMLIGVAAKNGVLIVEFINQMRDAGRSFEEAIIEASGIRLRPVVMTTISTVMGSIPLILATGAGSESRTVLGIVVFSGVSLAAFLTLFIVPSFYALLARRTGSPQSVARRLTSLLARKEATE